MSTMKSGLGYGTNRPVSHYRGTDSGTSEALYIPGHGNDVLVMVNPEEGATATVEYTISSPEYILRDDAIWKAWDSGDVAEATSGALTAGITAVRVVATGGAVTWQVSA